MNTQPEAMRLADYMEKDPRYYSASEWEKEAAAELRRLQHKSDQDDETFLWQATEIARLHEVNQELLAVCNKIKNHGTISSVWFNDLEAAIAKATN